MLYNRIMGTSPKGYSELFQPLLEQINWNPSILPYQNIVPSTNPPDRLFHQQFLRCPHIPPGIQMITHQVMMRAQHSEGSESFFIYKYFRHIFLIPIILKLYCFI
ncbi:proS [Gossypium arboreum]|uniref:ProS n=1 Tax=Gossypium arboreum TaxID=29729 RepID=A0A0B0NBF0_GOSAR|nr:proS [Gossypium arboreum]